MLRFVLRFIFWVSLIFIIIAFWTMTVGQYLNFEFKDPTLKNTFYRMIMIWTPVAMLLTFFGTMKKTHYLGRKIVTVIITIGAAALCYYVLENRPFTFGIGNWNTNNVLFQNRLDPDVQIREQTSAHGAFGWGEKRI